MPSWRLGHPARRRFTFLALTPMNVREILRLKGATVVTVAPDVLAEAAAHVLSERRVGALPVVEAGRVVGLFSERDLVRALARHGVDALHRPVRHVMTAPVETCTPESSLQAVMHRMTTARLRHLPVLDGGQLCGIVSIGDIVKHRLREVQTETGVLRDYIAVTRTPVYVH